MQFGVHFIFDGYSCSHDRLADAEGLKELLLSLPKKLSMHPITDPLVVEVGPNNKKDPGGVSGFVMIAESHISFHTFPNRRFVTADIYTCHDELDTERITELLCAYFLTQDFDCQTINRGTRYPAQDIIVP